MSTSKERDEQPKKHVIGAPKLEQTTLNPQGYKGITQNDLPQQKKQEKKSFMDMFKRSKNPKTTQL